MDFNNLSKEVDEIFSLHHYDLGFDENEVEDLLIESTFQQRLKWLNRKGYEVGGD